MNLIPLIAAAVLPFVAVTQAETLKPFTVRQGIPNATVKLRNGSDFTIVLIGGSITKGGGKNGFSETIPAWLQEISPAAKIKHINAGINGTDSDFGAARTDRDVLAHNPDLVFVEFAVNDASNDRTRAMERIVRKIWTADPATDIIFLQTISEDQLETYKKGELPKGAASHEKVADFYGIPTITLAAGVVEKLGAGANWKDIMRDGAHPNEQGYALYLEQIREAILEISEAGSPGRTLQAETLTPDLKLYPDPVAAQPLPSATPLKTVDGTVAKETYVLPTAGEHWRQEHEYKADGQNLWAAYSQPYKAGDDRKGGKLDESFGLSRTAWIPMGWIEERGAFDGPEGMQLWKGNMLSARENDLPVLAFIAPESGRYAFQVRAGNTGFNSHHKQIALNVVHFPWGKEVGSSIAFFKTDKSEKKTPELSFEAELKAGEFVAFCVDADVNYGGGTAGFKDLEITAGLLP